MNIAIAGTGYVGLVTGVVLSEIGHNVTCVDVDEQKIKMLNKCKSPIYEDGLEEMMLKNKRKMHYTTNYEKAYKNADVIFIGVGTPETKDGSANLKYIYEVCDQIATSAEKDIIVVIKSTVPIGTNDDVENYLRKKTNKTIKINVVSNPEFLSQGTAVYDTLHADRIIIGVENAGIEETMKKLYQPLTLDPYNIPLLVMKRRSAEMVKYACNNFLALKISFINEISNLCEKIDADIKDVALGMSKDKRIGNKFLNSGIGYGGSCFPKDTKALYNLSKTYDAEIKTIKSCIEVNEEQKTKLFQKMQKDFEHMKGLKIAVLGCSFKPGTNDLREAPSLNNINLLLEKEVKINVYDPLDLTIESMKNIYGNKISYYNNIDSCIENCDAALIITEHEEIKNYKLENYVKRMNKAIIYDGRNCYDLELIRKQKIKYVSMGREIINDL